MHFFSLYTLKVPKIPTIHANVSAYSCMRIIYAHGHLHEWVLFMEPEGNNINM